MKSATLRTFAVGIAAATLLFGLATSGRASLVIQQVSAPVFSGSWSVDFEASGITFDKITGAIWSGGPFEIPGLTTLEPGWSVVAGGTTTLASIAGSATSYLVYTATFFGLPADVPPVILNFSAFNGGALLGEVALQWDGQEFDYYVPEPTTMIAGALLLLPFGASTLRALRKSRAA